MLARIVFVGLIAVGIVGTTSGTIADEPDFLYGVCLQKSDRVALAAARESCDIVAETAGYAHGVLLPRGPFFGGCVIPPEVEIVEHSCFGVGGQ
jgi:hypothetical protein